MANPLVSISCITYNHGKFIRECLESFLMQETSFPFEILIHDDASTDETQQILREYARKYDFIKLLLQKENQYSKGQRGMNMKFNFPRAKGKYIALCEGDDYWTDPYKLQKQINFLEDNPGYSASFTNAEIIDEISGQNTDFSKLASNRTFTVEEIIHNGGGLFPTASLVFRNNIIDWPGFVFKAQSGDRALSLVLADCGEFYYLKEKTSVYRQHQGGIFTRNISNRSERQKIILDNIELLKNFSQFTQDRYKKAVGRAISELSKRAVLYGDFKISRENYNLFKNMNLKDVLSVMKYCVFNNNNS